MRHRLRRLLTSLGLVVAMVQNRRAEAFHQSITALSLGGNYQTFVKPTFDSSPTTLAASTARDEENSFPWLSPLERTPLVVEQQTVPDQGTKLVVLGMLWCVACLSALDRVAMSVALLPMSTEFDFTDTFKGTISSYFSLGYGLAILPSGLLVANLSPRLVMALGLFIWSLGTLATPLATDPDNNFAMLLWVRALVGAGESVILPAIQRFLTTWATPQEKSTALATIFTGFHAGAITAYVLSPYVMDHAGGWRGLFYLYGAFGAILMGPWVLMARDTPNEGLLQLKSAESFELSESWDEMSDAVQCAPWRDLMKSKGAWALLLAHCAKNWGLYNILAWTPTFYSEEYGIGVRDSALLSVLPSVTGAACGVLAAMAADAIIRNLKDAGDDARGMVRKVVQSTAFLGQGLAFAALALRIPEEPVVAQTFLMVAVGFMAFNTAGFESGIQEKAGEKWAGLLYSVTSLPAVVIGTVGVYATGRILDMTDQDWSYVFGLNAGINLLGTVAFCALYNSKREFD